MTKSGTANTDTGEAWRQFDSCCPAGTQLVAEQTAGLGRFYRVLRSPTMDEAHLREVPGAQSGLFERGGCMPIIFGARPAC